MVIQKEQLKHFYEWAKGINPAFAAMSLEIATSYRKFSELLNLIKADKRVEGDTSLPSLETWIKLYHNPERVGRKIFDALLKNDDDMSSMVASQKHVFKNSKIMGESWLVQYLAEFSKIPEKDRKAIQTKSLEYWSKQPVLIMRDFIKGINEDERSKLRSSIPKAELIFFLRVTAPCFILYGTYPHVLLKDARQGNNEALRKLIRLDKSVIFDPKISQLIHKAQVDVKQERMYIIKMAFRNSPKVNVDLRTIKYMLGGMISYFSVRFKQRIGPEKIRALFNAIARDAGIDEYDPDIDCATPETFKKAIQRYQNFWNLIMNGDIK